jgi:hypothetical protein
VSESDVVPQPFIGRLQRSQNALLCRLRKLGANLRTV